MSSTAAFLASFVSILIGAALGMVLRRTLPAEMLEGGSKEAIRLGAGFLPRSLDKIADFGQFAGDFAEKLGLEVGVEGFRLNGAGFQLAVRPDDLLQHPLGRLDRLDQLLELRIEAVPWGGQPWIGPREAVEVVNPGRRGQTHRFSAQLRGARGPHRVRFPAIWQRAEYFQKFRNMTKRLISFYKA